MSNNSSIISHAKIEYAIYGIWCIRSSPTIEKNIIENIKTKGIYLQESNAPIIGNTILNISNKGIDITQSSPLISDNVIHNTTFYGIKSYRSFPSIVNNTVSQTVKGIYLEDSTASIVGNRIASTAYGVYLGYSPGTNILDNQLEENGYGLYLVLSNSTLVRNNTITQSDFGFYTMSSSPFIVNSTVLISQHKDFHIAGESHLVTLNTTFDGDKVLVSGDSTLTVRSFLAVKVEEKNGTALSNASVEVGDNSVTIHASRTGSDGLCEWIVVTDRIYEGSDVPTENSTVAEVSYETVSFSRNPRDVIMSISHTEVFRVNQKPVVNITYPLENQQVDGTITITGTSSDEDGAIIIVEIRVDHSTWSTTTMSTSNWPAWFYQWDTAQDSNGEHTITVRATDDCLENTTFSITVTVNNEETVTTDESVTSILNPWIFLVIPFVVLILVLAYWRKRRKGKDEEEIVEKPEEPKVAISSDDRIERLRKAFEEGLISEEIYNMNLAKLEAGVSPRSRNEEEVSYVCPECNSEVEADAGKCDHCGAIFEDQSS
jgi:parallel beta-helix repeat protein